MHRLLFSRIGCTLQPIVSTEKCSVEKHERMTYSFQLVGHRLATSSMSAVWGQCSHRHTDSKTHTHTHTHTQICARMQTRRHKQDTERDMERGRETWHRQTDGGLGRITTFFELSCAIWVMLLKTGVQVSKPDPPEPCLPGSLFFLWSSPQRITASSMGNDYFKQSLPPPWDNSMHSFSVCRDCDVCL